MAKWFVDTSRWQANWEDRWLDFTANVVNVDDPGLLAKVRNCQAHGFDWGVYVWVTPGRNMHAEVQRALARCDGVGVGRPPMFFLDYEEGGVEPQQIEQGVAELEANGYDRHVNCGYYSNPWSLDHKPFLDTIWWLAAYPGGNDGSFPGEGSLRGVPRDWTMWQFSSGGNLDRNYMPDDLKYALMFTGTGAPAPPDDVPPKRKRVPLMWMAVIKDIGWVDLYAADGVLLVGMKNDFSMDPSVFSQVRAWAEAGVVVVPYENEAQYAPVRAQEFDKRVAFANAGKVTAAK